LVLPVYLIVTGGPKSSGSSDHEFDSGDIVGMV
jgi:hypothetical protein